MAANFNSLRRLLADATRQRVIPGAVVGVLEDGQARLVEAYGSRQVDPDGGRDRGATEPPATVETVYDLASLTKPLVTSILAMQAVERGSLGLDDPVARHLDLLDEPEVTVRRLLAHAAGFPAHRKLYELTGLDRPEVNRDIIVRLAAAEPLAYPPGSRSVYSDLGFILLGALLERNLGARLDSLAHARIFQPLGLASLRFLPLGEGVSPGTAAGAAAPIAPTERCPVRQRLVAGEVHDLNAYAMGGVAGHAGLFGSIEDILQLAFVLCAAHGGASAPGAAVVDRDVLRLFWQPAGVPASTWRLGWDGPSEHGSMAGDLLSRRGVGHLSFTGCSLWLDPEQATGVVVLCNRIHPEVRNDPRFRALRPAIHDEALRAIGYRPR